LRPVFLVLHDVLRFGRHTRALGVLGEVALPHRTIRFGERLRCRQTLIVRPSVATRSPRSRRLKLEQQVSWLPDRSRADLPARESHVHHEERTRGAVDLPPSSPVTVAGAASVFHRLPCCLVRPIKRVVIERTHYASCEDPMNLSLDRRKT
jgi:hypothetical protein